MELGAIVRDRATPPSGSPKPTNKRALRVRFYLAMLLADIVAIVLGVELASLFRLGAAFTDQSILVCSILVPAFLLMNGRSYRPEALAEWRKGLSQTFSAIFGALGVLLFFAFGLKISGDLSRILIASGTIAALALLTVFRKLIGIASRRVFDGNPLSVLLITDGVILQPPVGVQRLRADLMGLTADTAQPFVLDGLARCLVGVDTVFVACRPESRQAWASTLKGSGVRAELLIPELDTIGVLGHDHFAGVTTTLLSIGSLRVRDEIAKRILDLALVLPALIFLAPLLLTVALAIRFDSPGNVLFVQKRVGRGNRIFSVFKFRSMYATRCDGAGTASTMRDDVRITRVGRLIRSTSIDELPQLLNILRGDMSFVGPRPHALGSMAGDKLFWEIDPRYWHRHACKPGLTGLAQIRGFRGATHRQEDLTNRLRADLEYLNGWNVWRDVSIMIATIKVVVHRNAF